MGKKHEKEPLEMVAEEAAEAKEEMNIPESEGTEESVEKVLAKQLEESKDKYLRLFAEFDNYKKRTLREKLDMMKTAAQDTLTALLPVLDDFDRAKKAAEEGQEEGGFSEGVNLVYQKLYSTLSARGLKAMETNGEVFDPEQHEAITEIPAPTEDMKGKIIDTVEKGYLLQDKIIRYAKVVVGK